MSTSRETSVSTIGILVDRSTPPVHTCDAGHGGTIKVWPKTGSRGDYKEAAIERSCKNDPGDDDWGKQTINIPNSALPDVTAKLQAANDEHTAPQQQESGRSR